MEPVNVDKSQNPIETPVSSTPPTNPIRNDKSNFIILIGVILIILVIGVGGYYLATKSGNVNTNLSQTPTNSAQTANWRTYTNTYYNFKLDIPSDWKVEEQIVKGANYVNGEYQAYKLYSPSKELIIQSAISNKNNHIKQQLPNSKVQLGQYTVDRYPYINDDGERIDLVYLDNIKRQKFVRFDFTFNGDFEKNNELLLKILKTFAFTKQEPNLDDEITYAIPQGWQKEDTDTSLSLSFVSGDFHEEGLPTIVTGARITVNKTKRDPAKTLAQQTTPNDIYGTWNIATRSATFNSTQYTNIFACAGEFGFCRDYYSIEDKGNVWTITMVCNKNCNTKAGIDSTIYAKDRDSFINSLKFK